jgi:hypothetical protein
MVADIIHVYDISIVFQIFNVFSSSIFLYWCYSYMLTMDESKSEINVKCCAESTIICYIFSVMYAKN